MAIEQWVPLVVSIVATVGSAILAIVKSIKAARNGEEISRVISQKSEEQARGYYLGEYLRKLMQSAEEKDVPGEYRKMWVKMNVMASMNSVGLDYNEEETDKAIEDMIAFSKGVNARQSDTGGGNGDDSFKTFVSCGADTVKEDNTGYGQR